MPRTVPQLEVNMENNADAMRRTMRRLCLRIMMGCGCVYEVWLKFSAWCQDGSEIRDYRHSQNTPLSRGKQGVRMIIFFGKPGEFPNDDGVAEEEFRGCLEGEREAQG